MQCFQLTERIESRNPAASAQDVARICLLLSNMVEHLDQLADDASLDEAWQAANLRLQMASDQHAAMTSELQGLANSNPREFSQEQIWVLVRAIKVQSQILGMYLGETALDI